MKYLKIPIERVGVLIGHDGKIKNDLMEKTGLEININSEDGEVEICKGESKDTLIMLKTENIIRAIGRGFSPDKAFLLLDDEMDFYIFDLHDYVSKKASQIRRLKSRIIGKNGKTKHVIEDLTGSKIAIYGHTISIISEVIKINILQKAIDMLLSGSKHAAVYKFLEKQMKKLKKQQLGF